MCACVCVCARVCVHLLGRASLKHTNELLKPRVNSWHRETQSDLVGSDRKQPTQRVNKRKKETNGMNLTPSKLAFVNAPKLGRMSFLWVVLWGPGRNKQTQHVEQVSHGVGCVVCAQFLTEGLPA